MRYNMEVLLTTNSSLYEELATTDYATAKLVHDIHKETACIINKRYCNDTDDKPVTVYHVSWRKGR